MLVAVRDELGCALRMLDFDRRPEGLLKKQKGKTKERRIAYSRSMIAKVTLPPKAEGAVLARTRRGGSPRRRSRARDTQGEQGEGQRPNVTARPFLPALGTLPRDGSGFTVEFFLNNVEIKGHYKQHNAALKWFRHRCETDRNDQGLPF